MTDNILTITWGELEVGMKIVGGWKVVDLTATHITVASEEDGEMSTFTRREPWNEVQIEARPMKEIVGEFGGHIISEQVGSLEPVYYAWPTDPGFRAAAQSHLEMHHRVAVGDRSYDELIDLHGELHGLGDSDHTHINREEQFHEE